MHDSNIGTKALSLLALLQIGDESYVRIKYCIFKS